MSIWAICKDPGGTNGVIPVVKQLITREQDVKLIPNGKALELVPPMGIQFFSLEQVLETAPEPKVLVTSMCSNGGGIGRNLVPLMRRAKVTTVALEDYWGVKPEWSDQKFQPDYVVVNDILGRDIVFRSWPKLNNNQVVITGYPAMDKYAAMDVREINENTRKKLGIPLEHKVIFYAGQLGPDTEMVEEIFEALNSVGNSNVSFIARPHPRMPNNQPEAIPGWERVLGGSSLKCGRIVNSSACTTPEVIACADLVISMYSTVLIEAAVLRKQNISLLYPKYGMADFLEQAHGTMENPPLVDLGCSAKIVNRKELTACLAERFFQGNLGLQEAQEKHFSSDGKNASRVADFVESLL